MTPRSAGILLWRDGATGRDVWIAHMGGPFWARKDDRAWSIPKGEFEAGEDPLAVARREFAEEMGVAAPALDYVELGQYRYSSGKTLTVFAADGGAFDSAEIHSNLFELEWPPRSGRRQSFPEVDRAEWTAIEVARRRLVAAQVAMLDDLPPTTRVG
ncbi:NUDIX domain-containing protein [Pseudolysinimonas sp.]|uniref:NUDIX domain-containing protein n=1 Tax=Pseudolysinimonas sp. TaxID=2680009 RepID=UPI00286AA3A7|nr:NUDIX domain-containing protein [Pseudolysinimonas sp.]